MHGKIPPIEAGATEGLQRAEEGAAALPTGELRRTKKRSTTRKRER